MNAEILLSVMMMIDRVERAAIPMCQREREREIAKNS